MTSNGQTTTVISDDWITPSKGRKKIYCKKNDIENHSHHKVHSPAILAGTLSVLLRTKFKNDFMPILSTDKKLDRTQIIDLVSDAFSSQKEDVKISLELLRKITWIIKVIEYYIKSNNLNTLIIPSLVHLLI